MTTHPADAADNASSVVKHRECLHVVGLLEKLEAEELRLQLVKLVCETGTTEIDLRLLVTTPTATSPVTEMLVGFTIRSVVAVTFGVELSEKIVNALVAFAGLPTPSAQQRAMSIVLPPVSAPPETEWNTPLKPVHVTLSSTEATPEYGLTSAPNEALSAAVSLVTSPSDSGSPQRALHSWSEEEVSKWLEEIEDGRFRKYAKTFLSKGVNGSKLSEISASELFEDYNVMVYQDRKNLIQHIVKLKMMLNTKAPPKSTQHEGAIKEDVCRQLSITDMGAMMNEMQLEMQRQERANKLKRIDVTGVWSSDYRRYVLKQQRTDEHTVITGYIDDPKYNHVKGTIHEDVLDLRIFWRDGTGHEYAGELAYASGVINETGDTIRMNYSHERKGYSNQVDQNQIVLRRTADEQMSPARSECSGSSEHEVDEQSAPATARPGVQAKLVTARKKATVISLAPADPPDDGQDTSNAEDDDASSGSDLPDDMPPARLGRKPSEMVRGRLESADWNDELEAMRAEMARQAAVLSSHADADESSCSDDDAPADLRTTPGDLLEVRL